jgi:Domain of unknown function DUF302
MPQNLGFDIELPLTFSDAVDRVKDALKHEGFGILTEIDLRAAFREKLGREFRPYVMLGACNPPLAYSAITLRNARRRACRARSSSTATAHVCGHQAPRRARLGSLESA